MRTVHFSAQFRSSVTVAVTPHELSDNFREWTLLIANVSSQTVQISVNALSSEASLNVTEFELDESAEQRVAARAPISANGVRVRLGINDDDEVLHLLLEPKSTIRIEPRVLILGDIVNRADGTLDSSLPARVVATADGVYLSKDDLTISDVPSWLSVDTVLKRGDGAVEVRFKLNGGALTDSLNGVIRFGMRRDGAEVSVPVLAVAPCRTSG
ncbi:MAG: hypothetical protein R3C59_05105 [Planctomycetaceae bacterium]